MGRAFCAIVSLTTVSSSLSVSSPRAHGSRAGDRALSGVVRWPGVVHAGCPRLARLSTWGRAVVVARVKRCRIGQGEPPG
eukprot:6254331-Lingulodinium_polyedra.AAC.1